MPTQRMAVGGDSWVVVRGKKEDEVVPICDSHFSTTYEENSSSDNEQGPDFID